MNNRDRLYLAFLIFLVAYFFNTPLEMHPESQAQPTPTRTAQPTFTPTTSATIEPSPTATPTPDIFITEIAIEIATIESYNLNTPTPRPTPTSPPCVLSLPGSSSYGVGGCLKVNLFETVGYKSAALSLGEHRTNGDLTNSNIKCLALRDGGDVFAISNDSSLWQINADNSGTSEAVSLDNIGRCLWSPDGKYLAVEAADTVVFVPYFNDWDKFKSNAWGAWVGTEANKTRLIGWTMLDGLPVALLVVGQADYWLCHPVQGCRFVHEETLTIFGVGQHGLPHAGGYLWTAD